MSWLYSRALVEEYSQEKCSDGERSAPLNSSPTPLAYLHKDKMTEFSRLSRSGMMFEPLTASRGEELLTLYLADFHARTFQFRDEGPESQASEADYGEKCPALLAKYDPATHSLKTAQCLLIEGSTECSVILPRWGLMQNGELYQQPVSAHPIKETGSGLWPTPIQTDYKGAPSPEKVKERQAASKRGGKASRGSGETRGSWAIEPRMGRVAHGVAARVDRLKAIGNGQVPECAAEAWRILKP